MYLVYAIRGDMPFEAVSLHRDKNNAVKATARYNNNLENSGLGYISEEDIVISKTQTISSEDEIYFVATFGSDSSLLGITGYYSRYLAEKEKNSQMQCSWVVCLDACKLKE